MSEQPPRLAIVIVSWNTRKLLADCLAAVFRTVHRYPFEVIVVDNASSDGSAEYVRHEFPQVNLIETGANLGFRAATMLRCAKSGANSCCSSTPTRSPMMAQ